MALDSPRLLRADAARNAEKIVRAAREVFAEQGPDAHLDDVARRAGVGAATLFRRFPDKAALLRAVLDQRFGEHVRPVIQAAAHDADPASGLVRVLEAALESVAGDYNVLAAARAAGVLTPATGEEFFAALDALLARGQDAGVIRADLVPDDLHRIVVMLVSVLWTMEAREDGWRRYLALVLDGLSPAGARPLPCPAPALHTRTP
ncbi:TetR/AcrR family transcriptional regulator [Kitasatospora sp. NPDC127116]|uniref:TetR/AcrR family transcriptional regulator n=1 Tax=Kitasatospora sp. NPDC127116 TaxID=3345367 RepID=UPI00363ADE9D